MRHFAFTTALVMACLGSASASVVDHSGFVVAHYNYEYVLTASGEVYQIVDDYDPYGMGRLERRAEYDPPVPVSEIKFWALIMFVANNDDVWRQLAATSPPRPEWSNLGPPQGGAVQTDQSTWGKLKSKFKGE